MRQLAMKTNVVEEKSHEPDEWIVAVTALAHVLMVATSESASFINAAGKNESVRRDKSWTMSAYEEMINPQMVANKELAEHWSLKTERAGIDPPCFRKYGSLHILAIKP